MTDLTPQRRLATVTGVANTGASPPTVTIEVGGDTSVDFEAAFLGSYRPLVGDYVVALENQGDYVVIGTSIAVGATAKTGSVSAGTSAAGLITVTHGLAGTPAFATVALTTTTTALTWRISAKSSTTFSVIFSTASTGAVLVSTTVAFDWYARL